MSERTVQVYVTLRENLGELHWSASPNVVRLVLAADYDALQSRLDAETRRADVAVADANDAERKVAERDALLRKIERYYTDGMSIYGECEEIRALLSSAEPVKVNAKYGPTPGCKQCQEALSCRFADCPECDAQFFPPHEGDKWQSVCDLPEREIGASYRMMLDGAPQTCVEIDMDNTSKRWFRGERSGAYLIDEVQAWLPAKRGDGEVV